MEHERVQLMMREWEARARLAFASRHPHGNAAYSHRFTDENVLREYIAFLLIQAKEIDPREAQLHVEVVKLGEAGAALSCLCRMYGTTLETATLDFAATTMCQAVEESLLDPVPPPSDPI